MCWVKKAKQVFKVRKPKHFTNYTHCDECAEHDETLRSSSLDDIGLAQLGSPSWDPISFCSDEGKKYYLPALVRLSLETIQEQFYFDQFLFHLEGDGEKNSFLMNCSPEQRAFIASFVRYMIENYPVEIGSNHCTDRALRVYEIWNMETGC